MKPSEKIFLANEKVSIFRVLTELGQRDVPDSSTKIKLWCPFGTDHEDHGRKRALQVYPDTNTATCLAGCGFYRPVALWAQAKQIEPPQAAQELLDRIGWEEPTLDSRWQNALRASQTYVDTSNLGSALKKYCSRISEAWEFEQFEEPVSSKLQQCLALLPSVVTEEDAERWLSVTKRAMAQTLGVHHDVETD